MENITIKTEYIKLSQLLKLCNIAASGADSKRFIADGMVKVNGVVATERGKKMKHGDIVEITGFGSVKVLTEQ